MKKYSHVINRYFQRNKQRSIYTIVGITLGVLLITSILYINSFVKMYKIQEIKKYTGDYDVLINNVSLELLEKVEGNIKVDKIGKIYIHSESEINREDKIYALNRSALNEIFKDRIDILEGKKPENLQQVIMEKETMEYMDKKLNDYIVIGDKKYTIVGIYKENRRDFFDSIRGITLFNDTESPNNLLLAIKVIKEIENKYEVRKLIDDLSIVDRYEVEERLGGFQGFDKGIRYNEELLDAIKYGELDFDKDIDEGELAIIALNSCIIILTSILIYSSINISMREKLELFKVLRCMGATQRKIRYLIFKESGLLVMLSLIPGIILGNILGYGILRVIYYKIFLGLNTDIKYKFFIDDMFSVILLTLIIILISSILPIVKSEKISIVNGNDNLSGNLKKIRKNNVFRKIFGYEGELAYKNIKKNNKAFILNTIILSLLLIVFSGVSAYYLGTQKGFDERELYQKQYNIIFDKLFSDNEVINVEKDIEVLEVISEKLKKLGIEDDVVYRREILFKGKIKTDKDIINTDNISLVILNENGFEDIKSNIVGNSEIDNFKNDGTILVNGRENVSAIKREYKKPIDINEGDKIVINTNDNNKENIKLNLLGSIDGKYITDYKFRENNREIVFIISKETLFKYRRLFNNKETRYSNRVNVCYDAPKEDIVVLEKVKTFVNKNSGYMINERAEIEGFRSNIFSMIILSYIILIIAFLISLVNLINNKSINFMIRHKELVTMWTIGMKKKVVKKVIILESVIEFLYAIIFGGVISLIILKVIDLVFNYIGELTESFYPIWIVFIGILILALVSFFSIMLSLKKLKIKDFSSFRRNEE